MTIQQFYQMDEMDKVSAIMQYGRLMAQNADGDKRIFIYHLESFYVSAAYLKPNDQLAEINCYLEVDQLIPLCRKHSTFVDPSQREYQTPEA